MKVKGRVSGELALAMATKLGADAVKVRKDASDRDTAVMIGENLSLAEALGINGTPAVIIGDHVFVGAVGTDVMQEAITSSSK